MSFDTRNRLAREELSERLIEAALDQPRPTPELRSAVQQYVTYTRHRDRDLVRDRQPPYRALPGGGIE